MTQIARSLAALSITLAAGAASAGPLTGLGLGENFGLLTFGDARTASTAVYGSVAVGGSADIKNFSIKPVTGGTALIVGGGLKFGSGGIYGDTVIGGSYTSNWNGTFHGNLNVGGAFDRSSGLAINGGVATAWGAISDAQPWMPTVVQGTGDFSLGFDFAGTQNRLTELSSNLSGYANALDGKMEWSTLVFDAAGLSVAVFNIDASQTGRDMRIDNLAADATVIINVYGETVNFGHQGYTNFAAGQVLFNLPEATSVQLGGGITGSLLAPLATVQESWGKVDGQVVVDTWLSSATINSITFAGSLPSTLPTSPDATVPVPASLALLLGGLAVAGVMVRRREA